MRLLSDLVLIRTEAVKSDMQVGGIFLPTDVMAKPQIERGAVMAVGPKVVDVKLGDTALFDRYSGDNQKLLLDGQEHFLVHEPNVLAVLT